LFVDSELAGKKVRCSGCGERVQVPYQLASGASATGTRGVAAARRAGGTRAAQSSSRRPARTSLARIGVIVLATCLLTGLVATPVLVMIALPVLRTARERVERMEAHSQRLTGRQRPSAPLPATTKPALALGDSILIDDVRITPVRVRLGPLAQDLRGPAADKAKQQPEYLIVELTLENTSAGRDILMRDAWLKARLLDDTGQVRPPLFPSTIMSAEIMGRTGYGVLRPGAVLADLILFEPPSPAATTFRLEADPGFWRARDDGLVQEHSTASFTLEFGTREIRRTLPRGGAGSSSE
jgi:hypothetical protein